MTWLFVLYPLSLFEHAFDVCLSWAVEWSDIMLKGTSQEGTIENAVLVFPEGIGSLPVASLVFILQCVVSPLQPIVFVSVLSVSGEYAVKLS